MYLWVPQKINIEGDVVDLKTDTFRMSLSSEKEKNSDYVTLRFIPASSYFVILRDKDGGKHLIAINADLYKELEEKKAKSDNLHIQLSCQKYKWEKEPIALSLMI